MTTTQQFTVQHDSPYSERPTHSNAEFTVDQRPGLCQGRKSAGKHRFHSVPCHNPATRTIKAKPYTYQSGPYADLPGDEIELHVCGTHDLQAKGNRKAAEARLERQAQVRREESRRSVSQAAEQVAAEINALAGTTVVEVRPQFDHGYGTYPIVVIDSAALKAALPPIGGAK